MARLTIRLLGPVQVTLNGEPVTRFESVKSRALLALLAAEPHRPHRREALAEMLWPDRPEGAARANLRHTLAHLRRAIDDRASRPPFLLPSRHTIQFNEASDAWVDVAAFSALLPAHAPDAQSPGVQTVPQLEDAVRLYRGCFLEDISLADSATFEEWRVTRREHFNRLVLDALWRLAASYERRGEYEQALVHARRALQLEPWDEAVHQQVMRLLALTGHRAEALAQYETCRRVLAGELNLQPAADTIRLYEQIQQDELGSSMEARILAGEPESLQQLPGFLEVDARGGEPPVFVAREREMARLDALLDEALAGHGRVAFVTGGAGRGKTVLLERFGRQAMEAHPDLLVAWGSCAAYLGATYSGAGDPYLPFREVLATLTGDAESPWLSGAMTTPQARRLWSSLPGTIQALLQHGPYLIGTLVPEQPLMARAALWCATAGVASPRAPWLEQLRVRAAQPYAGPTPPEQSYLIQQVTDLLRNVAATHPLLLILDDLQWADTASIGLLFHLGRRLEGSRILIAGAYRPEEIALGRPATGSGGVERHPLQKVLNEFKRTYGDILLDLIWAEASDQRHFVRALLETEPNRLGEDFARVLAEHTGGHPLFTVELLRAMQARGDLVRDDTGRWIQGSVLDWDTLPARVEGVIEERVGRLEPELRQILSVASVEGEDFTVQVVAQVQEMDLGPLLHRLAHDLEARHRLVADQGEIPSGPGRLSRFKFSHALVQNYLYQHLGRAERRLLHGQVAAALEQLHAGNLDEFAVQLAHHFHSAGDGGRAFHYLVRAAGNAARIYANAEAITYYTRALEIAGRAGQDAAAVASAHLERGLVYRTLGQFELARSDHEAARQVARDAGDRQVEWRALLDLGQLWASRDYNHTRDCFQVALDLARRMDDPAALAASLNWMGNWHLNREDPGAGIAYHAEALQIFEELGDRRGLAATLDLLGIASLLGGDVGASVAYYDRAIALFRELGDRASLASSLTGRGHAGGTTPVSLTILPPVTPTTSRQDFEEAQRITREIGSPAGEAWVLWSVALLHLARGRYGQALEASHRCLEIATRIGHREWIVGGRCSLGFSYVELLAPEKALRQLEPALALAEELRSLHWIHNAVTLLAAAHALLDDPAQALAYLETVLSAETPMDTLHKRSCWARRAELALSQDDPALALDIVERLIASAPGMAPGRVITFLWKLKAEALAAMGHPHQAGLLLHAALENAQATKEQFLLWRLHASLGRLYRATDRPSLAEQEFSTARALVQELAATLPDEALRDHFLQRAHKEIVPLSGVGDGS